MAKGVDLAQHKHMFNQIISDLLRIEIKFDDENMVMMPLSYVLASYKHLVTTLLWEKKILKFEEILKALLDHYKRKQNSSESSGEGLMVEGIQDRGRKKDRDHNSTRGHSGSKSKSKIVKCYKCQKKWHIKRDCPKQKRAKDKDKERSLRSTNVVAVDLDLDGDILSISSSANLLIDPWILDSACFFHMTTHRDWFDTYKLINCSFVLMGNNAICKIIGIGKN